MPSVIPHSDQSEQVTRCSDRIICAETVQPSPETVIERAPSQTRLPAIKPAHKTPKRSAPSKSSKPSKKHPKPSKPSKHKPSANDRALKATIVGLRDEVELEWKPRVKSLKEKCDKLGKKVDVLEDVKEENAVMKRKLTKSNMEKEKI